MSIHQGVPPTLLNLSAQALINHSDYPGPATSEDILIEANRFLDDGDHFAPVLRKTVRTYLHKIDHAYNDVAIREIELAMANALNKEVVHKLKSDPRHREIHGLRLLAPTILASGEPGNNDALINDSTLLRMSQRLIEQAMSVFHDDHPAEIEHGMRDLLAQPENASLKNAMKASQDVLDAAMRFLHNIDPTMVSKLVFQSMAQDFLTNFNLPDSLQLTHAVEAAISRSLDREVEKIKPFNSEQIDRLTTVEPLRDQKMKDIARQTRGAKSMKERFVQFFGRSKKIDQSAGSQSLRGMRCSQTMCEETFGAQNLKDAFLILVASSAAHPDIHERLKSFQLLTDAAPREEEEEEEFAFVTLRKAAHVAEDKAEFEQKLGYLAANLPPRLKSHNLLAHMYGYLAMSEISVPNRSGQRRIDENGYWLHRHVSYADALRGMSYWGRKMLEHPLDKVSM